MGRENVEPRAPGHVEVDLLIQAAGAVRRLHVHAVHDLHHLGQIQGEAVDSILAVQPCDMLHGVVLRMIGEEKDSRQIVEPNVILDARIGIPKTEHDRRFDGRIKIGDPVVVQEIDVVVVNAADAEPQEIMKAARDSGIDAGGGRALDIHIAGGDGEGRIHVRAEIDRLFGRDRRGLDCRLGDGDPNVGKILGAKARTERRDQRKHQSCEGGERQRDSSMAGGEVHWAR
jgi:hypothetical protein